MDFTNLLRGGDFKVEVKEAKVFGHIRGEGGSDE